MKIIRKAQRFHLNIGTITRPADTTQYAAGDVLSDASGDAHFSAFSAAPRSSGTGLRDCILREYMITSTAAQATLPALELWCFSATVANRADNATFIPTDAEMATLIGVLSFPAANWVKGNATAGADGNACTVITGLSIYLPGALLDMQPVFRNAYTPVSGEIFTFSGKVEY